ncbi:MAG: DUF1800 domain-containing protein [Verrucomicrobiales bacterium]|nr:DUF1800 domain-containing protein [Verrucomicrobiales bacterium]
MSLTPLNAERWNDEAAAHLLNRAGFGGPPDWIREFRELGLAGAVDRLLSGWKGTEGAVGPEWAKPDPERGAKLSQWRAAPEAERREMRQQQQELMRNRVLELRRWWLDRMVTASRPLEEKMVLFWHGHFATSVQKVKDPYLMFRQLQTFRRHAAGSWQALLMDVTRDPAMLVWLDQAQSRREQPNENYAREVMELFALGEGHYAEQDVKDAARAFTGLTLDRVRQEAAWRPRAHDDGLKQVLGRSGRLKPEDVIQQIVLQPQASRFLCAKLWRFFAGDPAPAGVVGALAEVFERNDRRVEPVLRALFRSAAFYEPGVVRTQIKSPVQWLVMALRQLERPLPEGDRASLALKQLGQDLLAPPNVKGWDGGVAWINTSTLTLRQQYASMLVLGREGVAVGRDAPRARGLRDRAERRARVRDAGSAEEEVKRWLGSLQVRRDDVVARLEARFLQSPFRARLKEDVLEALGDDALPDPRAVLQAVATVLRSTDYQLT